MLYAVLACYVLPERSDTKGAMKDIKLRNKEKGAIALLKSLPIELGDIYGLMAELVEASKGKGKRAIVARAR